MVDDPTFCVAAGLGLLERSIGYARGALGHVTPGLLGRPTPCSEWDLTALLHHMDDSLLALVEATEQGYVDLSPPGADPPVHEPLGALLQRIRTRACDVLGSWSREDGQVLVSIAGSPLSAALTATAGALEVAVHGSDVAVACGRTGELPAALATDLLHLAPLLVSDADRPSRFGPPLHVSAGASPSDRLLAWLGRQPGSLPVA